MRTEQISFFIFTTFVLAALSWLNPAQVSAQSELPPGAVIFDFDTSNGIPLERGQTISSITVDGLTMGIDVESNGDFDTAMIFDTSNPGAADPDLGAPNETCPGGGPGVGVGGVFTSTFANCEQRGNVMIIPELVPFDPAMGPDDFAGGGVLTLSFDVPIRVLQVDILDIDDPQGEDRIPLISFLDASGSAIPFTHTVSGLITDTLRPDVAGDNGYEEFLRNDNFTSDQEDSVRAIRGTFVGSGALAKIIVLPNPSLDFRKFVNGFDANTPETAPVVDVGAPLTWTYRVTNTGQIAFPLASVVVTDTDPAVTPLFNRVIVGNADTSFDPNEVWEYIDTGVMPDPERPDTNGDKQECPPSSRSGYINGARVTINEIFVEDIAIACPTEVDPEIRFRKFVNGFDANTPETAPEVAVGAPLTWTYRVTNTGEVAFPLASVVVTDTDPTVTPLFNQVLVGNADESFEPGEVWEYIDTGIMPDPGRPDTNGDKQDCSNETETLNDGYINGARVTIETLTDTDIAIACPAPDPGLEAKRVNTFEFSYVVTNPPPSEGGVSLENVVVRAASPSVEITCGQTMLSPGESMTCEGKTDDIAFRNSLGWVTATPVGGGAQIIRVVLPEEAAPNQ